MKRKFVYLLIISSYILWSKTPLEYINFLRVKAGSFALKYDKTLALAASKHANYINVNSELSHYENSASANYFASTPWNRIKKAGFKTKLVVENISFYEKNYTESINKLMGTVYHRLAFLYLQVDSIGYSKSGRMYVYDMSNSKIAALCNKHYKDAPMVINSICPIDSDIIPKKLFDKAINSMKRRAKSVIIYPYRGQSNVPTLGVEERPKFRYSSFGYPITATFNSYYGSRVNLISFKLFNRGKEVACDIVSSSNDIHNKIRKGTFVLVPLNRLKHSTKYSVELKAKVNGKLKTIKWSFTTA